MVEIKTDGYRLRDGDLVMGMIGKPGSTKAGVSSTAAA